MTKKRVALIGYEAFPIPAIKGGAIESGVTMNIDMNEKYGEMDFTVLTIKDPDLNEVIKKYKHTRFIQISKTGILNILVFLYKIIRKLTGNKLPYKSTYMIRVNRILEKEQFDIVYFYTSHEQVSQLSSKVKGKVLYSVASDYLNKNTPEIDKVIKRVDYFTSNKYITDRLRELLGIPETQVHYSTKGYVDTCYDDEPIRNEIRLSIRQKHSLSEKDIVVLYCGRLSPEKGCLQLIQAVQKVSACKLIVIGGANFSSNKQTDYVKQLQDEADKCEGRVIFTGYLPDHSDLKKYAYASDIACVPSICNEAGSYALLEFRAAGKATVASDMGGMRYNGGDNVVWVECNESYVDNLANAIQDLCDHPEEIKRLSDLARIGIEAHSLDEKYKNYCKFLNSL